MQLYGPHPIASLEEAAVDYLEWCATGKATPNAPKTIQCKGRHLRTIGELLNKRPDQIVEFDLLKIRKSLRRRMAGPTVNRHMATLSDMMRYLRRHNVILASPCVGIERYQETEQTRTAPNDVDVDSLVASCGAAPLPWMGVLITLLFDTGVRVNEALRARQADVDFSWGPHGLIHPPPSKRGRDIGIPLLPRLRAVLEQHLSKTPGPYLFPHPDDAGRPCDYNRVRRSWCKVREAAGLPELWIHDLRAGAATELGAAGAGSIEVQTFLRQKTPWATPRYTRTEEKHLLAAIERRHQAPSITHIRGAKKK